MDRRDFLKTLGISTAGAAVAPSAMASTDKKPNLLIIHTDEHNFRTLGCYRKEMVESQAYMWGYGNSVETPNIDWLAENGVLSTKCYAATPVCSPSRASFVSGQYPQNTPVHTNDIALSDEVVTFAEILKRNGYTTGYAGKWHLDGHGKPQWEPERDFGFEDNRYMFNRGHWKLLKDTADGPQVGMQNGKPSYKPIGDEKTFTTDFLCDKAIEFMKTAGDKPFCYMISIPDPHGPDTVREPYHSMYQAITFEPARTYKPMPGTAPSWAMPKSKGGKGQATYFGMVKCIDDNVGKILAFMRENYLLEDTIIVFTSDHGDLRGEHMRDNKGVPFEASAKIPFIVSYPKKIQKGITFNEAINTTDFLPSVLSLMNVKTAGREEGRDASQLLMTGNAPEGWNDVTFMRGTEKVGEQWLSAVSARYKLIYSQADNPYLFDLAKDPDEFINYFLNPEYRSIVRDMSTQLVAYGEKCNDRYVKDPKIAGDLKWAMSDSMNFVPTEPVVKNDNKKKAGRKKRKK